MSQEQLTVSDLRPDDISFEHITAHSGYRDIALYELLGTDYEFAHNSGLINLFYYNPDTGEDGLMHTLGGEYYVSQDGTRIPSGFHHEPSANVSWVYDSNGERIEKPTTHVDREHLKPESEESNAKHRKRFLELPYNPYSARVIIDGLRKMTHFYDPKTGERTLTITDNGMFPKEYDALAVMQAVKQAVEGRDKTKDVIDLERGTIVATGESVLLDGKTKMHIRMILDAKSGKVKSAFPKVRPNAMKLSRQEIKASLGTL